MKSVRRISATNSVLLVCDIQERFRSFISNFDHLFLATKFLVESGKILRIPFIFTEQNPTRLGSICNEINIGTNIFAKQSFSMYTPEVELELKKHDRKNAVLFGLETHGCIFQTALDLIENEYHVHIVVDAVSSQKHFDRTIALERMQSMGCFLTTSESLLFTMLGSAEHESFKEISRLAKDYSKALKDISNPLPIF